jgi:hypothetical protein
MLLATSIRRQRKVASRVDQAGKSGSLKGKAQAKQDALKVAYLAGIASTKQLAAKQASIEIFQATGYRISVQPKTTPEDAWRAHRAARGYAENWLGSAEQAKRYGSVADAANAATATQQFRLDLGSTTETSAAVSAARGDAVAALLEEHPSAKHQLFKVWDSRLEKNTCSVCSSAHGTLVPVADVFPAGEPGTVHPKCACTWHLVTAKEADFSKLPSGYNKEAVKRRAAEAWNDEPISADGRKQKEAEEAKRAKLAEERAAKAAEQKRLAEEKARKIAEEKRQSERIRKEREAAEKAERARLERERLAKEAARKAEEAQKAAEAKRADEQRKAEELAKREQEEAARKRDALAYRLQTEAQAARDKASAELARQEAKKASEAYLAVARRKLAAEEFRLSSIDKAASIRSRLTVTTNLQEARDARLLDAEQRKAIGDFTGNSFGAIRRAQSDPKFSKKPDFKQYAAQGKAIEKAIEQNVLFEGELWRGITVNPDDAKQILDSGVLSWGGKSTSTSVNRRTSEDFSLAIGDDQVGILFRISNGRGLPVSDLGKEDEQEILQSGASTFRVVSKSRQGNRWVVELEQVHSKEAADKLRRDDAERRKRAADEAARLKREAEKRAAEERKAREDAERKAAEERRKQEAKKRAEEAKRNPRKAKPPTPAVSPSPPASPPVSVQELGKSLQAKDYEQARATFRRHFDAIGMQPAARVPDPVHGGFPDGYVVKENTMPYVAYHSVDGTIAVRESVLDEARQAAAAIAQGKKVEGRQAQAIGVLMHEEIHGYGNLGAHLYRTLDGSTPAAAARLEEVLTEALARTVTRKSVGSYTPVAYNGYIGRVAQMIAEVEGKGFTAKIFQTQWVERLAGIATRVKSSKAVLTTERDFIKQVVEAVDGLDESQRRKLLDLLDRDDWGDMKAMFIEDIHAGR